MISIFRPALAGFSSRLAVPVSLLLSAFSPCISAHTLIASDVHEGVRPWAWCAVNRGAEVDVYRYLLEGSRRGGISHEVFHPPVTADEMAYSRERVGMRSGRSLKFFDTSASFRHLPQLDFQLPAGTNEILLSGDRLGVRTGRTLRHYNIAANYRPLPKYDFTVPEGTDELVIAVNRLGSWLGVRTGTTLQFYNIDRGYEPDPKYLFTLPDGTDEVTVSGPLLLVMRGDRVEAYDFERPVMDAPRLVVQIKEPAVQPLETLHGKAFVSVTGGDQEHLFEFWAKGNRLRTEEIRDGKKVVTIQYGDTLYSYTEGEGLATTGWLGEGLASLGFINQISEVQAHGERGESKEIDGVQYHQYIYRANAPEEVAVGYLSATSSLPESWTLAELEEDGRVIHRTIAFRDLEENVAIPDNLFHLPRGLTFQE